jgi:hypothetical protein
MINTIELCCLNRLRKALDPTARTVLPAHIQPEWVGTVLSECQPLGTVLRMGAGAVRHSGIAKLPSSRFAQNRLRKSSKKAAPTPINS